MLHACPVEAQGLREFREAEEAYTSADYALAVRRLEPLVGTEPPPLGLQQPLLVPVARTYLAVSYLFVDREDDARGQFRLLLADDPDFVLDETLPSTIRTVFESVRDQFLEERRVAQEAQRLREAEQRAREIERLRRQQEREMRLRDLARTETIETQNSRWLCMLPFGVGQFQNGHDTLGYILLVSEALFAVASITSAVIWNSLADQTIVDLPDAERVAARDLQSNLRLFNAISSGLFYATAVAGIVDAQLRYVPYHRTTRERPLPPDLEPDYEPEEPDIAVSISPFGASLRLSF